MKPSLLRTAASHAGITELQAQQAITSALRSLHRVAVTSQEGLTSSLLETRFNFGAEAAYHLAGLLEHQRLHCDPELPWGETLKRMAPETRIYHALIDRWLAGDGDPEPL
jgi:hypothetical protein